MTVYAYTRVSTVDQLEGTSMADQADQTAAAARLRRLPAPVLIADPGVSASVPLADRPGGAELLQRVERGDTIIALKLDRMFRDASDALAVAKQLQARGIDLILLDISTDPVNGSGMGKVIFGVMAVFAELERTRIAERMQAGRAAKRAAGGATGQAPFGYVKVGMGKAAMLEPDPAQQEAITTILRGHEAGMTLRAIRDLVHAMHPAIKVSHVTVGSVIRRALEGGAS